MEFEMKFHALIRSDYGSDGLGIYYLRDIDKKDVKDINYQYTSKLQ